MTTKKKPVVIETPEEIVIASDTLGKDLLTFLIQEFKALQKPWQQLSESEQNTAIDRAKSRIEHAVTAAISILFGNGCVSVIADIEGVAIKDNVKCILKVSRTNTSDAMQVLFTAHNQPCRILLASPEQYLGGMDEVTGESDQSSLPLDAPTAEDDPLIDEAIKYCRENNKASISGLQRHLQTPYNRAARIVVALEDKGIISTPDSKGTRTVFPTPE